MLLIRRRRRALTHIFAAEAALVALLALSFTPMLAQDVSVTRLPIDTDMTVRLTNLNSHVNYDRSGDSYFIVPAGRYSVQLLRDGQIAYQEVEYIDADSPDTRIVNPNRMEILVGLSGGNPQFDPSVCGALEIAAQLAIRTYGFDDNDLQRRLNTAEISSSGGRRLLWSDASGVGDVVDRVQADPATGPSAKPRKLSHLSRPVDATDHTLADGIIESHSVADRRSQEWLF